MNVSKISCFLLLLSFLTACNSDKNAAPVEVTQVKSATTTVATDTTAATKTAEAPAPDDGTAIATITAPAFVSKIHHAIAFVPKNDGGVGMMKLKPGYRYVVLDMSVRNTSKSKEVDMGQILLTAKISDDKGKEYRHNAMAIAAYTLDNPDPHHQAQYNALWGKLKPGDFFRTVVFGIEAPESAKNFVISMKEDGDTFKEGKRFDAKFSIDQ